MGMGSLRGERRGPGVVTIEWSIGQGATIVKYFVLQSKGAFFSGQAPAGKVKLADLDGEGLGLGVTGRVGDGERVRGCLCRRVVNATGVRRPDGIGLRLELDGFGVGHAVAELDRLTAASLAGSGVKGLDRQFLAAHLFESGAILLALLFGRRFSGAIFDGAVLPPAGEENPENDEGGNREDKLRVERGLFENGFGRRNGLLQLGLIQQSLCPRGLEY